ncbi:hypothetical protein CYMTET_36826 [Cymbomonas tetramitiformis]|uniref:Uncharacterized protein n=1 Tax=Cymbomonas tetramitiformis TaxID=36881 RepID=A0AAE0F723_9CHLO|nr:hypothetical protein CYMTET_36826 [Cymbomonas tetramitiformis]
MGRSKLPGKAALEMPAEASEQPCGVVASRTRSKTGLPPAGGTSGCQAPIAPAQTPPQVSAKVPMERPSGTVTSRSRSNTKSPPQQEAVKPATPPTVVLTDAPRTRKPPAKSASQSRRESTGRLHQALFERLQSKYGKFDVDACRGPKGRGQLVDKYWENCLKEQWRGLHVWCSPPHDSDHLTTISPSRLYSAPTCMSGGKTPRTPLQCSCCRTYSRACRSGGSFSDARGCVLRRSSPHMVWRHACMAVDGVESTAENPVRVKDYVYLLSDDRKHDHRFIQYMATFIALVIDREKAVAYARSKSKILTVSAEEIVGAPKKAAHQM